jgi:hypothetical protein
MHPFINSRARIAVANSYVLLVGKRPMFKVEPDAVYIDMWRVRHPDGGLSDKTNLARAKDIALDLAEGIEARKTPHKSALISLKNFRWSSLPVAQKEWAGLSGCLAEKIASAQPTGEVVP